MKKSKIFGHMRLLSVLGISCCVAITASACGSSVTSSTQPKSAASMFKGKTITFISPDAPGGSFNAYTRLLAPLMAKYLGATINVENIPAGNTIIGQNTAANSAPNGMTIGWVNVGEDISDSVSGIAGVTFNIAKVRYLGAPTGAPLVMVASPSSHITTFKQLVAYRGPNIKALDTTAGTGNAIERLLLGAYATRTTIVTGYENSPALVAGFLAGEGPIAVESLVPFTPAIETGKAIPLVTTGAVPKASPVYREMRNVPTLASLLANQPPASSTGKTALKALTEMMQVALAVDVPAGTPTRDVIALRKAMAYAMSQASFKTEAVKEGLTYGLTSGSATKADIVSLEKIGIAIKPYLAGS